LILLITLPENWQIQMDIPMAKFPSINCSEIYRQNSFSLCSSVYTDDNFLSVYTEGITMRKEGIKKRNYNDVLFLHAVLPTK